MKIPLNIDWQQILLHALNLALLVGGLYLLLFRPVKKFMDDRAARCRKLEEDAQAMREDARRLLEENRERARHADEDAQHHREETMAKAEQDARALLDSARAQAAKILSDARAHAAQEEQRIVKDAQSEIAQLSVEAAHKLVDKPLNDVYDQFLDAVEGSEGHARP